VLARDEITQTGEIKEVFNVNFTLVQMSAYILRLLSASQQPVLDDCRALCTEDWHVGTRIRHLYVPA